MMMTMMMMVVVMVTVTMTKTKTREKKEEEEEEKTTTMALDMMYLSWYILRFQGRNRLPAKQGGRLGSPVSSQRNAGPRQV